MLKRVAVLFLLILISSSLSARKNGFLEITEEQGVYKLIVPDDVLGKDILFGSRVVDISKPSAKVYAAGQMRRPPVVVKFRKKGELMLLDHITDFFEIADNDLIEEAVARNKIVGAAEVFNIESRNIDDNASIIDVTDYFSDEVQLAWPLPDNVKKGKIEKKLSGILYSRQYKDHFNIRSYYEFTGGKETFAITVQYFMLLLPENPLKKRYNDSRVGYNTHNFKQYQSGKEITGRKYINRWRIEPKAHDLANHEKGKLSEPLNPIVIYIEPYFPKEWVPYIKQGAEDWNKAFEKIGFKNVIQAKEYPDNTDFDPYDIKTNVIRYIPLDEANAAGQIWTDPRSGEIINGEVLWWNDVVSLIKMWRFTQTAAVDPEARKVSYSDKVMGEMVRYAIAHEIGHMLGLQHNMRSSYAYSPDSLRSAVFTKKFGTTASIMDYARNNHIARPGDLEKGVKMTPPYLGPFDYLSIEYGYSYIHNSMTPHEEHLVLDSILQSKQNDPFYLFAPFTASPIVPDPSAQSGSLGNDILISSANGIENTRIIIDSLVEWTVNNGGGEDILKERYDALVKQYFRYISLSMSYIGGEYQYQGPVSQIKNKYERVDTKKQKEALEFIVENLVNAPEYIEKEEIYSLLGSYRVDLLNKQRDIIEALLGNFLLPRIIAINTTYEHDFNLRLYFNYLDSLLWKYANGSSVYHKNIQIAYITKLKSMVGINDNEIPSNMKDALIREVAYTQLLNIREYLSGKIKSAERETAHYKYLLKLTEI